MPQMIMLIQHYYFYSPRTAVFIHKSPLYPGNVKSHKTGGGRLLIINNNNGNPLTRKGCITATTGRWFSLTIPVPQAALLAAAYCAVVLASAAAAAAEAGTQSPVAPQRRQEEAETTTLSNIPQTLSGGECASSSSAKDCTRPKIQRPKSRKAESCTIKCVTTCIRGGEGSPGEGPLNVRRPLVVFKQGFRSRRYCLIECSAICNLIGEGDDGP